MAPSTSRAFALLLLALPGLWLAGRALARRVTHDRATAAVSTMLHLRVDWAIDVVAISAWLLTFCLAWALGDRLLGRNRGAITAPLTLLGGGLALVANPKSNLVDRLVVNSSIEGFQ